MRMSDWSSDVCSSDLSFNALVETGGPLLVHCSAGKDRTGFFCALLLHLLGVEREMIVADFMLSAREEAKLALRPEIERRFSLHGHLLPQATILDAILGVRSEEHTSELQSLMRIS